MKKVPAHSSLRPFIRQQGEFVFGTQELTEAIDCLSACMLAAFLSQSGFEDLEPAAKQFLANYVPNEKTKTELSGLSNRVGYWIGFDILSRRNHLDPHYSWIEFRLRYSQSKGAAEQSLVRQALVNRQQGKLQLAGLLPKLIRPLGDPLLHLATIPFPFRNKPEQKKELEAQIEIAKLSLQQAGGLGITANQCSSIQRPYRFVVFETNPDQAGAVTEVQQTHLDARLARTRVLINPIIIGRQGSQHFLSSCPSLPGQNRIALLCPNELILQFTDPEQNFKTRQETFSGLEAGIIFQLLDICTTGKSSLDRVLADLSAENLNTLELATSLERMQRPSDFVANLSEGAAQLLSHWENGQYTLSKDWENALRSMSTESLLAVEERCRLWTRRAFGAQELRHLSLFPQKPPRSPRPPEHLKAPTQLNF